MITKSSFKPAWWLSNAHAQTLYASVAQHPKPPIDRFERLELPDGDFIDLAWAENGLPSDAPLVILLHGLGGDLQSSYVARQLLAYNQYGWRSVFMHFRGASPDPNRLPRFYHSGETGDLDYLLQTLTNREPLTQKALVGFSMGGNVLLKWLGEQGKQSLIDVATAISVPFELEAVVERVSQGFSRVYQAHLLSNLRSVFTRKFEVYPEALQAYKQHIYSARTFRDFDEYVTAPVHGFSHAQSYYDKSSSRQYLPHILTPTLVIHALDDPFMTPQAVPKPAELSPDICLELSDKGGHVGFIGGQIPGKPTYWLEERIPRFLSEHLRR